MQRSIQPVIWFFGIGATLFILYSARWIVLAALIGIGLGTVITPGIAFLKRRFRVPTGVSAFLFLVILLAGVLGVGYLIYSLVADEVVRLSASLPDVLEASRRQILDFLQRYPWIGSRFQNVNFVAYLSGAVPKIFEGAKLGLTAFAALLFVMVLAVYTAVDPASYVNGVLSVLPAYRRRRAREVLEVAARNLRQWCAAQAIALSSVGVATGLGLGLIGVKYAAFFGVLTAILDVIPYIGPIIAFCSIFIVTLGTQPNRALYVIGLFVLIQQFEAHLVIPVIMRNRMSLPPVPLMLMMLAMAMWFGFIGIFVATPLLCVLKAVYVETHARKMNRLTEFPSVRARTERAAPRRTA